MKIRDCARADEAFKANLPKTFLWNFPKDIDDETPDFKERYLELMDELASRSGYKPLNQGKNRIHYEQVYALEEKL